MKQLFAIFGNPVVHSKSPLMHNLAFKRLKYPACYTRYLLRDGERLREAFFSLGLKGANVTVPHKEAAFKACDVLDHFAQKVGAVNTIVERGGKLYGYNTDAPGFLKTIKSFPQVKTVLFLGAGGTAKATAMILRDSGYGVTLLNRSAERLKYYEEKGFETYTFENFKPKTYDLVVNMTSAGLENDFLPAPEEILEKAVSSSMACIDVIYGKNTPFLQWAKTKNKPTKDGSDMLLYQGVIAFDYFTDHRFTQTEIELHMRKAFLL
ncbi:MAG: shikimate dehydrogenase [Campylobacterota bacterium]|nr:shikimate dehydrogenase [Campylobacterota bacterium]